MPPAIAAVPLLLMRADAITPLERPLFIFYAAIFFFERVMRHAFSARHLCYACARF